MSKREVLRPPHPCIRHTRVCGRAPFLWMEGHVCRERRHGEAGLLGGEWCSLGRSNLSGGQVAWLLAPSPFIHPLGRSLHGAWGGRGRSSLSRCPAPLDFPTRGAPYALPIGWWVCRGHGDPWKNPHPFSGACSSFEFTQTLCPTSQAGAS